MLGQLSHKPETVEGYILTSGWLFSCFILAASFTAELASFLMAERQASVVSLMTLMEACPLGSFALLLGRPCEGTGWRGDDRSGLEAKSRRGLGRLISGASTPGVG